jgi:hypothetical protein
VPVVVAGIISVFASCAVVCVPVALGSGGVTVWGGANSVLAVRAVVKAVGSWRGRIWGRGWRSTRADDKDERKRRRNGSNRSGRCILNGDISR